jgi:hypothetical protein
MRLSGLRRFWVALAILPLIGGVALASGPAMFVCRGDGVPRIVCCCPDHQQGAPAPRQTTPNLSAGCCCDISQANAPVSPAAEPRVAPELVGQLVLAPLAGATFASPAPSVHAWPAAALAQPPPAAIPILLAKQSFLV